MAFKRLMTVYQGNIPAIPNKIHKVLAATMKCYGGDCGMCRRHSMVCDGGITLNWWNRSMFLWPSRITVLNISETDTRLLLEVFKDET